MFLVYEKNFLVGTEEGLPFGSGMGISSTLMICLSNWLFVYIFLKLCTLTEILLLLP